MPSGHSRPACTCQPDIQVTTIVTDTREHTRTNLDLSTNHTISAPTTSRGRAKLSNTYDGMHTPSQRVLAANSWSMSHTKIQHSLLSNKCSKKLEASPSVTRQPFSKCASCLLYRRLYNAKNYGTSQSELSPPPCTISC